jgi:hypothetical protein
MDAPEHYKFRLKSHLGPSCAAAFAGLSIRHEEGGETVLSGPVADQAALHGILMQIRDLGLILVEVRRLEGRRPDDNEG